MNLKRTSLEIANIKKEGVESFLDAVSRRGIELHDFMLLRGSYVCYEAEWTPYRKEDLHMLYSLSKAFTAIGIGFAVQEGLLKTEDYVYPFFQEELEQKGYANTIGEKAKKIKIEHLLTMSTGQTEEPPILNYEFEGNWAAQFLQIEPVYEPGTAFFYDTTATYILSAILTKLTGEKLVDYLKPRFFEPLGIDSYVWDTSPQGNSLGGIGLNVTIETIAKLGVFLLQEGKWQDRQLLDSSWIKRMTSRLVRSAGGDVYDDGDNWGYGYGYQIWQCIPEGTYRGDGAYGQLVIVAPNENVVIATLAGTEDMGGLMDEMWEHLLPACLPVENQCLKEAASEKKTFLVSFPEGNNWIPASIFGTYELAENEEGIQKIQIQNTAEDELSITCFYQDTRVCCLKYGYENWMDNRISGVSYAPYYTCGDICTAQTAGSWAWEKDHLNLKLCYLNGPLGVTAKFVFSNQTLSVTACKHRSMALKTSFEFFGSAPSHPATA